MARLKKPYNKKLNNVNSDCDLTNLSKHYEIEKQFIDEFVQYGILIERWGTLSWRINELANQLRADMISESHFREKVREIVDEYAIKKIVE